MTDRDPSLRGAQEAQPQPTFSRHAFFSPFRKTVDGLPTPPQASTDQSKFTSRKARIIAPAVAIGTVVANRMGLIDIFSPVEANEAPNPLRENLQAFFGDFIKKQQAAGKHISLDSLLPHGYEKLGVTDFSYNLMTEGVPTSEFAVRPSYTKDQLQLYIDNGMLKELPGLPEGSRKVYYGDMLPDLRRAVVARVNSWFENENKLSQETVGSYLGTLYVEDELGNFVAESIGDKTDMAPGNGDLIEPVLAVNDMAQLKIQLNKENTHFYELKGTQIDRAKNRPVAGLQTSDQFRSEHLRNSDLFLMKVIHRQKMRKIN